MKSELHFMFSKGKAGKDGQNGEKVWSSWIVTLDLISNVFLFNLIVVSHTLLFQIL